MSYGRLLFAGYLATAIEATILYSGVVKCHVLASPDPDYLQRGPPLKIVRLVLAEGSHIT